MQKEGRISRDQFQLEDESDSCSRGARMQDSCLIHLKGRRGLELGKDTACKPWSDSIMPPPAAIVVSTAS